MIGVFDSGVGGLTVLRELLRELPECGYVYLGDTARVPYGPKGSETIRRYAREGAEFLLSRGARLLVLACNTMSAVAAEDLRAAFPEIPIVDVVAPAVQEAVRVTTGGCMGVIGTRATIASGVYERISTDGDGRHRTKINDRGTWYGVPTPVRVVSQACPLLVPLVEEGWLEHAVTRAVIREYLAPLREAHVDTLILGCTHYPFLESVIAQEMGEGVTIVNPARAVAAIVREQLERDSSLANACRGTRRAFHFTDTTPHTEHMVTAWLGMPVMLEHTELLAVAPFTPHPVLH